MLEGYLTAYPEDPAAEALAVLNDAEAAVCTRAERSVA